MRHSQALTVEVRRTHMKDFGMLHCAILGDSLAAGVATYRPECRADTQAGITSGRYAAAHLIAVTADVALVSLGVNDGPPSMTTAENLVHLRTGIQSRLVIGFCWPIPTRRVCLSLTSRTPSATD